MSDEVIFRAIGGALKDEEFVFEENGLCLIGRSSDCALQIPREKDMRISRRHCLLILNPPKIRIRDLGSRNGTFVNGEPLPAGTLGDVPEQMTPQDCLLKHGDKVNIGATAFEVLIPSQKAAGTSLDLPPPGTKIIKLAKPEKTFGIPSKTIKKSTPVDTGFFVPPPVAKGARPNTATAPLTEVFSKPPPSMPTASPGDHSRRTPTSNNVQPAGSVTPPSSPEGSKLVLKAKSPGTPVAQPIPPPLQSSLQPSPSASTPRKVLKGKIVKKTPSAPPVTPAAPAQPGAGKMGHSHASGSIDLGARSVKNNGTQNRIKKFKIKPLKK